MRSATLRGVQRSLVLAYAVLTPMLCAFLGGLYLIVARAAPGSVDPNALLAPIVALVALTGIVLLLMLVVRNVSVARGAATVLYYQAYRAAEAPSEWIERPARAFMNLLEVPVLFYLVCVLMLITRVCDAAQVQLAWLFVAMRVLHAIVYIGVNHVPSRLGAWLTGCATLAVMWFRFAAQVP